MAFATGRPDGLRASCARAYEVEDIVGMVRAVHAGRVVFHDGDAAIAPGIEVHRIGGHTRGLQAVRVADRRGRVGSPPTRATTTRTSEQGRVFSILDSAADVLEGFRRLRSSRAAR